jgi:hypothetical protein
MFLHEYQKAVVDSLAALSADEAAFFNGLRGEAVQFAETCWYRSRGLDAEWTPEMEEHRKCLNALQDKQVEIQRHNNPTDPTARMGVRNNLALWLRLRGD